MFEKLEGPAESTDLVPVASCFVSRGSVPKDPGVKVLSLFFFYKSLFESN